MKTDAFRIPVSLGSRRVDGHKDPDDTRPAELLPGLAVTGIPGTETDYLWFPEGATNHPFSRLVVMVPAGELDDEEFALRAGRLGKTMGLEVVFLALATGPDRDSTMRRRMANLNAYAGGRSIPTTTLWSAERNWLKALRKVQRAGDLVVCPEGHPAAGRPFRKQQLAHEIVLKLGAPVYVLRGIKVKEEARQSRIWRSALIWAAALLTIGLFGYLQIRIQEELTGVPGTFLQILALGTELYVLLRLSTIG